MVPVVLLCCICATLWTMALGSSNPCPKQCKTCDRDNQGQLIKVTCTDIVIPSLPLTVRGIHVLDAASTKTLPLGQLKAFIFTKRSTLETLIVQNYKITSIEDGCFKNNNHLRTLDLSKNRITSLKADVFEGLTNLTYLNLNLNRLVSLNGSVFQYLTRLKELRLAVNLFENIGKQDFLGLDNLIRLDLQSNAIAYIHPSAFNLVPNLQDINLQHNHLHVIEEGVFKGLNSLQAVNLQNNAIVSLEPGCMSSNSLLIVNLAQNNISTIPTTFLTSVSKNNLTVNLARNMITEMRTNCLKGVHLNTLYLVSNAIEYIEQNAFLNADIDIIDLEQNQLVTLPVSVWSYMNASHVMKLGNNPWSCDCNIQWLAMFLQRKGTSAQEPVCAKPIQFFGNKMTEIAKKLSNKCKDYDYLSNSLHVPPKHVLVTPELQTVPQTYPGRTPHLRSTRSISTSTVAMDTTSVTMETPSISQETRSSASQNTLTSTSKLFLTREDKGQNQTPTIAGVCVGVVILLCFITGIAIYRVIRSRVAIDTELSVQCRKPDNNFKPRMLRSWLDEVT